jgi:hypothetical protein
MAVANTLTDSEGHIFIVMLSVVMLNAVILNIVMPSFESCVNPVHQSPSGANVIKLFTAVSYDFS